MEPLTQVQTTPPPAAPRSASRAITSDFETFLRMLTTQMTNQDPLDPMDSTDFAVQLATFSGVEQQVQTNELLKTLSLQLSLSGLADMAGWIGREARAPVPARFDGAPLTLYPAPDAGADRAELVVVDAAGNEVQRLAIPLSAEPVVWAGVGPGGAPLPAGTYAFEVESLSGTTVLARTPAEVYATIREVRSEGSEIMLAFEGGGLVSAGLVTALRTPGS